MTIALLIFFVLCVICAALLLSAMIFGARRRQSIYPIDEEHLTESIKKEKVH